MTPFAPGTPGSPSSPLSPLKPFTPSVPGVPSRPLSPLSPSKPMKEGHHMFESSQFENEILSEKMSKYHVHVPCIQFTLPSCKRSNTKISLQTSVHCSVSQFIDAVLHIDSH